MLQRKQSIFLGLSGLMLILAAFFPYATLVGDFEGKEVLLHLSPLDMSGVIEGTDYTAELMSRLPALSVMAIALVLVAMWQLVVMFRFKQRKAQVSMLFISSLLHVGLMGGFLFFTKGAATLVEEYNNYFEVSYLQPATILVLLSFVASYVARHFILKDEALIRSVDRIR